MFAAHQSVPENGAAALRWRSLWINLKVNYMYKFGNVAAAPSIGLIALVVALAAGCSGGGGSGSAAARVRLRLASAPA